MEEGRRGNMEKGKVGKGKGKGKGKGHTARVVEILRHSQYDSEALLLCLAESVYAGHVILYYDV